MCRLLDYAINTSTIEPKEPLRYMASQTLRELNRTQTMVSLKEALHHQGYNLEALLREIADDLKKKSSLVRA